MRVPWAARNAKHIVAITPFIAKNAPFNRRGRGGYCALAQKKLSTCFTRIGIRSRSSETNANSKTAEQEVMLFHAQNDSNGGVRRDAAVAFARIRRRFATRGI